MRDSFAAIGMFIIIVIIPIILMSGLVRLIDKQACKNYAHETGRETKYSYLTCYTKHNGIWYDGNEFNNLMIGKGFEK